MLIIMTCLFEKDSDPQHILGGWRALFNAVFSPHAGRGGVNGDPIQGKSSAGHELQAAAQVPAVRVQDGASAFTRTAARRCAFWTHSQVDDGRSLQRGWRMRSIILAGCLAVFAPLFLCDAPAAALRLGADFSSQQYTVVIGSTKGICTGVVMEQNIVLTAAHCAQDAQNLWIGGHPGWGDLSTPPVGLSPVLEVVQHPRYIAPQSDHDLALLKLAKPLPDRFIPASFGGYVPHDGDGLIVTGYGESFTNDPNAGTVLRMTLLRASGDAAGYLTLISPNEEPRGASRGDSGGPVFAYRGLHALVGIVVAGFPHKTIAVLVAPHYVWIKDTIEKLNAR
jgi:Trypsin